MWFCLSVCLSIRPNHDLCLRLSKAVVDTAARILCCLIIKVLQTTNNNKKKHIYNTKQAKQNETNVPDFSEQRRRKQKEVCVCVCTKNCVFYIQFSRLCRNTCLYTVHMTIICALRMTATEVRLLIPAPSFSLSFCIFMILFCLISCASARTHSTIPRITIVDISTVPHTHARTHAYPSTMPKYCLIQL